MTISFKQFLSEDTSDFLAEDVITKWFTTSLPVKQAIGLLNKHAKQGLLAIQNGGVLYRGFKQPPAGASDKGFVAIDSASGFRTSRDTDNLYQLMMSVSSSMKAAGIHDRHKSLICSSSRYTTSEYGQTWVVVPLDGARVSVNHTDDIFNNHLRSPLFTGDVNEMDAISSFLVRAGGVKTKGLFTDAKQLNEALGAHDPEMLAFMWADTVDSDDFDFDDDEISELFANTMWGPKKASTPEYQKVKKAFINKEWSFHGANALIAYELFKKNKNNRFTALANSIMTPDTLRVKSIKYGETIDGDHECWYAGKAILISRKIFTEILVELARNKFPIHKNVLTYWDEEMEDFAASNDILLP